MSELKAGRELDALVAKKVMEEPKPEYEVEPAEWAFSLKHSTSVLSEKKNWIWLAFVSSDWEPMPFSSDIKAAFDVVDEMLTDMVKNKTSISH